MYIKSGIHGASIAGIKPEAVMGVIVCLVYFLSQGWLFELNSGLEGKHGFGSLHFVGLAFDIDSDSVPPEYHADVTKELKKRLGEEFDVVFELSHWHIEFQPKRRRP